ncbi:PAS domain-containing sensor histidine kinase [Phreatobacter stygius]|uniref:histidine kinase n=1 Tax=Phreatobacter stygius TaxID=1940610 RepID=A0A4D7AYC6_9HYPH|nr:PAS domain-containing sensor histidine kinase [Phreatobacter stygius]QCI66514.1 PAS domain S-box protein [Phreatobacter stygius]
MRQNALVGSVRSYLDGLVHPAATVDPIVFIRHRAFIATRLMPGLMAFSALPLYLALQGVPGPLEAITFGWLLLPIAIAFYLSRTGRYETAHLFSAAALTGIVALVAALSGGTSSFVIIWFALVPAEAVLSGSRRVVAASGAMVLGAVAVIGFAGLWNLLPDPRISPLGAGVAAFVSVASAVIYALGLALSAAIVSRTGEEVQSVGERRYRLLAEHMTDLITRHGRSGAVTFASPAAERVAGVPPFALHGQGLFDRVHIADRPAYLNALSLASARGTATSAEFRLRRERAETSEPTFVWVEMRCHPLSGPVSEDHQVVSVLRDVSERKSHEAAVDAARTEADRANEARGRFLANVSHELRTPLNAINGFSEMLMHEEAMRLDQARRKEYATLIRDSGEHLLNLVNSILDMSKIESGNFEITAEPFDLAQLMSQCIQMMQLKADEGGIKLLTDLADNVPEVIGDKRSYRQIVLNLLSNAIKFTKSGGSVQASLRREGAWISLSVADTGIGIAAADLPRLGSPFFQARATYDRQYEGTGLGLSVVKGLAELHGGCLEVASVVGQGTRVTLRMPMDCEAAARNVVERLPLAAKPAPAAPVSVKQEGRKIA